MKRLFTLIVVIIVVVIAAIIGTMKYMNDKYTPDSNAESNVIDIEGTIQNIGELATSEFIYTITQQTEKSPKEVLGIELGFTSSHVVYSYDGIVKAGVNFENIKIHKFNDTVSIKMPESIILSNEVKNDSLKIYDEKNSIFNKFSMADFNIGLSELKNTAEQNAIENDLLKKADDNARDIIRNTIKGLCGNSVEVKFE